MVPTLALLLGIPIPKNSVGALLPELFDTFTGRALKRRNTNDFHELSNNLQDVLIFGICNHYIDLKFSYRT